MADKISAGLQQLLIEVRGFNLGDHLAGFDLCTDIGAPALQIARDAGKNRRAVVSLESAGQIERGAEHTCIRGRHGDAGDRLIVGPGLQVGLGLGAGHDAGHDDGTGGAQANHSDQAELAA